MATVTTLNADDTGSVSRSVINTNFTNLNTDKAELDSPAFTRTPSLPTGTTAVTQSAGDSSTKIATTEFVGSVLADISCFVYKDSAGSTGSGSYTKQDFQVEAFDTNSMHSTITNPSRITIQTAGKYCFGGTIHQNTGRASSVQVIYNNTSVLAGGGSSALIDSPASCTGIYTFAQGDYIELQGASNGVGTTTGDIKTNFWAYKI